MNHSDKTGLSEFRKKTRSKKQGYTPLYKKGVNQFVFFSFNPHQVFRLDRFDFDSGLGALGGRGVMGSSAAIVSTISGVGAVIGTKTQSGSAGRYLHERVPAVPS